MAKVTSYSQLLKELQKARDRALEGTGKKTEDVVKKRIDTDVYDVGDPKEYIRTFELRESIKSSNIKSSGDIAEVEIKHDTSLIHSNPSLNQHASAIDGSSSVDSIAEIVHDGKSGKLFGQGFWTKKRPYMDNAKEEMEDGKYKQFMMEELKRMGYKVK